MDTSPSKRRVLGPVDVNSRTPGAASKLDGSKAQLQVSPTAKRPLDQEPMVHYQPSQHTLSQPAKRQRVSISGEDAISISANEEHQRQRSDSPEEEDSLMFDNSTVDNTQATTITEPDTLMPLVLPPPPPRRQPSMTREEARQKAEKLRLRLGLASYKVRTGQTDVPLDQLKVKPIWFGRARSNTAPQSQEKPSLPPLPRPVSARGDADVETEDERRARLVATARSALPSLPPRSRGQSLSYHSGASKLGEGKLLPLPVPVPVPPITPQRPRSESDDLLGSDAVEGLLDLSRS
ncbi:hypothetical protein F4819DRAFT_204862 [Hypoxylon fuscum]|nr:hypothetical protein F4819DRAFT_204862 [Hypoxylon fuscum]